MDKKHYVSEAPPTEYAALLGIPTPTRASYCNVGVVMAGTTPFYYIKWIST